MKRFFYKLNKYSGVLVSTLVFSVLIVTTSVGVDLKHVLNYGWTQADNEIEFVLNNIYTQPVNLGDFVLPTSLINISNDEHTLSYQGYGLVQATNDGVIKNIHLDNNGNKVITLAHSQGYITQYAGVEYLGVVIGDTVGAGMVIATCNKDIQLNICIYKNNSLQKVGDISWQK